MAKTSKGAIGGEDIRIVTDNRKAGHNYFLEEFFEAGLVLKGTEVKSLRNGKANLSDAYAVFQRGEVFLLNAHIAPYDQGNRSNHEPLRSRKLLLNQSEINRLSGRVEGTGYSMIPTKLYFKKGLAKVEIALAKGKKSYDKRATIKERESKRALDIARKQKR